MERSTKPSDAVVSPKKRSGLRTDGRHNCALTAEDDLEILRAYFPSEGTYRGAARMVPCSVSAVKRRWIKWDLKSY